MPEARVLDLYHFAAVAAEELVADTARETHRAVAARTFSLLEPRLGLPVTATRWTHDAIAGIVHTSVRVGVRGASLSLKVAADAGVGPEVEHGSRGRFVRSALNGLVGDRFVTEGSPLAVRTAVRMGGADVPLDELAEAFPGARGRIAVLLHGLSEDERCWRWRVPEGGRSTPELLEDLGWTPVLLRANTGLSVRENGVVLAALLQELVGAWPVPVERIVLVGHSMGGLIQRAACAVAAPWEHPWTDLVSDVVTLGTPHLGAPLAAGITRGSALLGRLPETAAIGRILEHRSVGVRDLDDGLPELADPPHIRFRLVSGMVTRSSAHPVGRFLGDLLVRMPSAHGEGRGGIASADRVHVPRADHFDLLNHPTVHDALRSWLTA